MDRRAEKNTEQVILTDEKIYEIIYSWLCPGEIDFHEIKSYWKKVCQECKASWNVLDGEQHRPGCKGKKVLDLLKTILQERKNEKTVL